MESRKWVSLVAFFCMAAFAATRKFDHVVVVMEENRSFDHLLGWSKQLGIDGLSGNEFNLLSTLDANSPRIYVDQSAPYINPSDPDHSTYATTSKIYGMKQLLDENYTETMGGFVEWENFIGNKNTTAYSRVMSMFPPARLPVMNQLAEEFAVMDRFFASVPGCTWPNRQFAMAGTSAGNTETFFWYNGTPGQLYPSRTIFDQLESEGFTWKNYYQDSPWELMMETIAHNPDHLQPMETFFSDAAGGTLPNYAFINPRGGINTTTGLGANDMHPDHDVALGEAFYKSIYEAVRNGPAWNKTLLIVTFDEHGGFYDHVTPPTRDIPRPDDHEGVPDFYFTFDRLGIRIVTLLISPWTPKGMVISEPPASQKPANNSEYELTSIMSTVRKLFNMTSPALTRRDAWSATFEHAFSEPQPRTDCPAELVPAPSPTPGHFDREDERALSHLQAQMLQMLHHLTEEGHHPDDLGVIPLRSRPSHSTLRQQGQFAQWMQDRFGAHLKKTRQWLSRRSCSTAQQPYRVIVGTTFSFDWTGGDMTWNMSGGVNCTYVTIATKQLVDNETGVPYCLAYNLSNAESGDGAVYVAPCYPTRAACYNRDPTQHWLYSDVDSSIRPSQDSSRCLTTNYNNGDSALYILPCNGTVTQHWSWFGPAPGDFDRGFLFFGIGIANLGVIAQ